MTVDLKEKQTAADENLFEGWTFSKDDIVNIAQDLLDNNGGELNSATVEMLRTVAPIADNAIIMGPEFVIQVTVTATMLIVQANLRRLAEGKSDAE